MYSKLRYIKSSTVDYTTAAGKCEVARLKELSMTRARCLAAATTLALPEYETQAAKRIYPGHKIRNVLLVSRYLPLRYQSFPGTCLDFEETQIKELVRNDIKSCGIRLILLWVDQ